jgi:putative spermidine/putrescine transport system ATP-binding protein
MNHEDHSRMQGAPIALENISKHFGKVVAVDDISLNIKSGEYMTFLGPSGSGKTTTLMMIAGFLIPSAGDIQVDGRSITTVPPYKRNIGMVFQNYALFPHMSIFENIAFPLQMRRTPKDKIKKKVNWALDLVQLRGFENRRPSQLSGGQQQRIAVARALVFEPPVLLLDEPLGALDAKLREGMQIELKQLHNRIGATILYVTHDQEEALTLSDRIVVFNDGKIMQVGTPDDLYQMPQSRFVADFIGKTNFLTGKVSSTDNKICNVQLEDGIAMHGPLRNSFATPKSWATYSLRPEQILVGDEITDTPNTYEATVEEFLYLGEFTKYHLRIGDSVELIAKSSNRLGRNILSPGSKIKVGWDIHELLLVETEVPA